MQHVSSSPQWVFTTIGVLNLLAGFLCIFSGIVRRKRGFLDNNESEFRSGVFNAYLLGPALIVAGLVLPQVLPSLIP